MTGADQMEIHISLDEADALAEFIDFVWDRWAEPLAGGIGEDTARLHAEMGELLSLHDTVGLVGEGEPVTAPRELLSYLLKEGGEHSRESIGWAMAGDYEPNEAPRKIREAKALMSLAKREGLYEGVMA